MPKKSKKKSYANWFEKLSSDQLSTLLESAGLPKSGSRPKKLERLLASDRRDRFAKEQHRLAHTGTPEDYAVAKRGNDVECASHWQWCRDWQGRKAEALKYMSCSNLQTECEEQGLRTTGNRFELVVRLLSHASGKTPAKKRARDSDDAGTQKKARVELVGEALERRVTHRRKKLSAAISARLAWKQSMAHMTKPADARAAVDCEPEVFRALFGATATIKASGEKMSVAFADEEACHQAGVYGKSYRYGATASLLSASASFSYGKLTVSFKYMVRC
jgi:hypothetical protein